MKSEKLISTMYELIREYTSCELIIRDFKAKKKNTDYMNDVITYEKEKEECYNTSIRKLDIYKKILVYAKKIVRKKIDNEDCTHPIAVIKQIDCSCYQYNVYDELELSCICPFCGEEIHLNGTDTPITLIGFDEAKRSYVDNNPKNTKIKTKYLFNCFIK